MIKIIPIDKKFNEKFNEVCKKLKVITEELKQIATEASNCMITEENKKAISEAAMPFLETEIILYEKGYEKFRLITDTKEDS